MSAVKGMADNTNPLGVLLSLIDPKNEVDTPSWLLTNRDQILTRDFFEYAKRNGLGYILLQKMQASGFDLDPENATKLENEKQRIETIRKTISMLNDVSNETGINYVLIKMPNSIPHVPRDLDIFVPYKLRKDMIDSLEKHGMMLEHSSVAETSLKSERYVEVDIYSKICYFNFEFFDDKFFADSIEFRPLFDVKCPMLNEEGNLTLELLHDLFGHRNMTLLDFLNLNSLTKNHDVVEKSKRIATEYGWGPLFDLALDEFNTVKKRIYEDEENVPFPYVFDRKFILDCISTIDNLSLSIRQRSLIRVSLVLDEFIVRSKDIGLYEALRANSLTRRMGNSIAHSVRIMRGDRKTA